MTDMDDGLLSPVVYCQERDLIADREKCKRDANAQFEGLRASALIQLVSRYQQELDAVHERFRAAKNRLAYSEILIQVIEAPK